MKVTSDAPNTHIEGLHGYSEELEGPNRSPSPSPTRRKVKPEHKQPIVLIPVLITATDFIGALAAGKLSSS